MEEILASIRRIIEDSDSARKATDDGRDDPIVQAAPAPAEDFRYEADDAHEDEAAPEVEAFRTELAEPQPVASEPARHFNGGHASSNGFELAPLANGHEPMRAGGAEETHRETARNEFVHPAPAQAPAETHSRDEGARGAIISEFAGRQVAAAFEELSEAFSANRKRSYDEIAEEIMRPMLQDWLDNNLPLLVERLVREEIERVARGGVR